MFSSNLSENLWKWSPTMADTKKYPRVILKAIVTSPPDKRILFFSFCLADFKVKSYVLCILHFPAIFGWVKRDLFRCSVCFWGLWKKIVVVTKNFKTRLKIDLSVRLCESFNKVKLKFYLRFLFLPILRIGGLFVGRIISTKCDKILGNSYHKFGRTQSYTYL